MKNINSTENGKAKSVFSNVKNAVSAFFAKKGTIRAISAGLALVLSATTLAACTNTTDDPGTSTTTYNNETDALILGTEAVDGAFNPFFYTSGTDGDMVGMTQIGMLTSDDEGQPLAGADEDCVALAYGIVTTGSSSTSKEDVYGNDTGYYTDYYFAIKDNIQFSDGEYLTINDVLFNIYMYLDPAYSGSSTMYSVDIQGLSAYRTQTTDLSEQAAFEEYFDNEAETRINAIKSWANNNKEGDWENASEQVQSDIAKAEEYFKEELESDWNAAPDLVESYEEKYGFTEGWEVFLWEYGLVTVTKTKELDGSYTYTVDYNNWDTYSHDQTTMVNLVYEYMLGEHDAATETYKENLVSIITYYATASNLRTYLASAAMTEYFSSMGGLTVTSVSGITTYEDDVIYDQNDNGVTEAIDLGGEYSILKIRINGVDPKAIQNFSFTVAPGHYYSVDWDGKTWDDFTTVDGEEYFGVAFGDTDFMTEVKQITVPMGAGPYRASYLGDTGEDNSYIPEKGAFLNNNIIRFVRNNYFHLGTPKIKYINYKVLSTSTTYDSLDTGEVHYASPQATYETITKLGADDELEYVLTSNLGYGYIGINATYVNNILVRRAIMYAMDTQMCVDYYGSALAEPIYRSMSKTLTQYYDESWDSYYPYDETGETSLELVQQAGYTTIGSDGVLQNSSGDKLKFTFTIAGDSTDHPAYNMLQNAATILNNIGFDVTVVTDANALSKLSAGTLTVWAAAWSSSSDPDMYQVYHKDSTATSVNAWGYPYLLSNGTATELNLLNELADLIEEGREYTSASDRAPIYAEALDLVMELAIELPTYQRRALYAYRTEVIDGTSLYQNANAYKGPLSELWNVSFVGND